jgi:DnaK suppressor protein
MDESRARALLRAERAEVATLLRDTEDEDRVDKQAPDSPVDFGDAGLPLTEDAEDEAVAAQLRDRLAAIDRALARLEAGTYGRSVISGKPIPDQRLEADPAAELTVEEARAGKLPARPAVAAAGRPAVTGEAAAAGGTLRLAAVSAVGLGDPGGDLRPGPESKLDHHVGDVPGHGGRADHQLRGDRLVAVPVGDQGGDL